MKVILNTETGDYAHYIGEGEFAFSPTPHIYPENMTLQSLAKQIKDNEGFNVLIYNLEMKRVKLEFID